VNEHGDVFFYIMPSNRRLSVPLQTVCTSTSSLSAKNFVRVHRFEAAYQLDFVRSWLKKDISMLMRLTKDTSVALRKGQGEFSKS
jgi:hypothetical protein